MLETISKMRELILEKLELCKDSEREMFVRMYGPQEYIQNKDNFLYSIEALAKHNIDTVITALDPRHVRRALQQVERTLEKHKEET